MNLKDNAIEIIIRKTSIEVHKLDPDADFRDQIDLDSLQLVDLVATLEKELDLELPLAAISARTINEFLSYIEKEDRSIIA